MRTNKIIIRLLPLAGLLWGVLAMPQVAMANTWSGPHARDCGECHQLRGASYPNLVSKLCTNCHFDGGPATSVATHSSKTIDNSYGNWDLDCWSCHNPHSQEQDIAWGTSYGKYVKKNFNSINGPTAIKEIDPADPGPYYTPIGTIREITSDQVEFKGNTEFVDNDGLTEDDICQVCHENTGNFSSSAVDSHTVGQSVSPGANCTATCHLHTSGFGVAVGSTCFDCHSITQGSGDNQRRIVWGASGDFVALSHHVTDGSQTEVVTEADCLVCHDQDSSPGHQNRGDPVVLLNDADDGGTTTYTYDGTGGSIEGFCLACHDADSSLAYDPDGNPGDGNQPFSSGNTPQDIATAWAGASHGNSAVSELANEKCLACHGGADSTRTGTTAVTHDQNVHGAASPKMISGLIAGQVPANLEEGICYTCHDGDPAPFNIEAEFNGATDYQWDSASTAKINQRHDITAADQTYSGGVVECSNCHNPHIASLANRTIDPDSPATAFAGTYDKANTYTRDGYNFSFQSAASDLDPMNPIGCTPQPAAVGPAVEGVHNGDDNGASGGTYTGLEDQTYTAWVTTGGAPGVAEITVTSTGSDSSGPTSVSAFDTPIAVGTLGATITFTDGGSGGTPGVVGSAVDPGGDNDDTAVSGGSYAGMLAGTYTVTVTATGRPRDATVECTGLDCGAGTIVCQPTSSGGPQCAYDSPFAVGTNGVTITISDGVGDMLAGDDWTIAVTGPTGDGVLTSGDNWSMNATQATAGCIATPEPDMVTFCLVCHDGTTPAGVTMSAGMVNMAAAWGANDQHGNASGTGGGNGHLKAPWQDVVANGDGTWANAETTNPYAALQCNTCHDGHGSDNLFQLKSSISVRGQPLTVGGGPGSGMEVGDGFTSFGSTTYNLPCFDGGGAMVDCSVPGSSQQDHQWGGWCTFCHDMQTHGKNEDTTCQTAHMHGSGGF